MTLLDENLEGKKETTLFGGRGLEKTLNWFDDGFSGYLKIKHPEDTEEYYLFLSDLEIALAASKADDVIFYGKEPLEKIKEALKDGESIINAFSAKKEKINDLKQKYKSADPKNGKISSFKIKDVSFPNGNFLIHANSSKELKKILSLKPIDGFAKSEKNNAAIVIEEGKVIGGIYSDKFGTLKRENSIIDLKQSFPYKIAISSSDKLDEVKKSTRFQNPEEFWKTTETQEGKRKLSRIELVVKNQEGTPIEDATVDIRKEGKKVFFGQTTKKGKVEKKLRFGKYQIWVKKEGYKPKGVSIEIEEETVRKQIFLEEIKTVNLGIQILSKNQLPVKDAEIEVVRGIDKEITGKTDKIGIIRGNLTPGIYNILIEKGEKKFRSKIKVPDQAIGKEKNFHINLPYGIKEMIERNEREKEKEKFTSFIKRKLLR